MARDKEMELTVKVRWDIEREVNKTKKKIKEVGDEGEKAGKKIENAFRGTFNVIQGVMGAAVLKWGANLIKETERVQSSLAVLRGRQGFAGFAEDFKNLEQIQEEWQQRWILLPLQIKPFLSE